MIVALNGVGMIGDVVLSSSQFGLEVTTLSTVHNIANSTIYGQFYLNGALPPLPTQLTVNFDRVLSAELTACV